MKEIRETVGVAALIVGVASLFFGVSILAGMIFATPYEMAYLLKMLLVDAAIAVFSFSTVWILGDEVWDRKNLSIKEIKRRYNLR